MKRLFISAAAASLSAAATLQPAAAQAPDSTLTPMPPAAPAKHVKHLGKCPDSIGGYLDSDATAKFVKKCLGRPMTENSNPDGRFVYMYSMQHGALVVGFLFDRSGKLIRPVVYRKN